MLTLKQKYQEGGTSSQSSYAPLPELFKVYYYDFNEKQPESLTPEMHQIITNKTPQNYNNTNAARFIISPIHQEQNSPQVFLSFLYNSNPTVNKPINPKIKYEPLFKDAEEQNAEANQLIQQLEQLEEQTTIAVVKTGVSNIYRALVKRKYLEGNTETDPKINHEGIYYKIGSNFVIEIILPLPRLLLAIAHYFNLNALNFTKRTEYLIKYLKTKKGEETTTEEITKSEKMEQIEKMLEQIKRIEQNKTMLFNSMVNHNINAQINLYFKDIDSSKQFNIDFSTIMDDFKKIIDDANKISKVYSTASIEVNDELTKKYELKQSQIQLESLLKEIHQKTIEYLIFYNKIKDIMDNNKSLPEVTVKSKISEELTKTKYEEYSEKEKNISDLLELLNRGVAIGDYDSSTTKQIQNTSEMYYNMIDRASSDLRVYYNYVHPAGAPPHQN